MTEKFDPAPHDKHANTPKKHDLDRKKESDLKKGLEDSFPASDPPSTTQPSKTVSDAG